MDAGHPRARSEEEVQLTEVGHEAEFAALHDPEDVGGVSILCQRDSPVAGCPPASRHVPLHQRVKFLASLWRQSRQAGSRIETGGRLGWVDAGRVDFEDESLPGRVLSFIFTKRAQPDLNTQTKRHGARWLVTEVFEDGVLGSGYVVGDGQGHHFARQYVEGSGWRGFNLM